MLVAITLELVRVLVRSLGLVVLCLRALALHVQWRVWNQSGSEIGIILCLRTFSKQINQSGIL